MYQGIHSSIFFLVGLICVVTVVVVVLKRINKKSKSDAGISANQNTEGPTMHQLLSEIYSPDAQSLTYSELNELRVQLLNQWSTVKHCNNKVRQWDFGFERINYWLSVSQEQLFEEGDISWDINGGITDGSNIIIDGVKAQDYQREWERLIELPHGNNFPRYNERKVSVYKFVVKKTIYFGFDEVTNGVYCYWTRSGAKH